MICQVTRERHYHCALVGALQHQANSLQRHCHVACPYKLDSEREPVRGRRLDSNVGTRCELDAVRHQSERDAASNLTLCCSESCQQHVNVTQENRCHHQKLVDVMLLLQQKNGSDSSYKLSALLECSGNLTEVQQISAACIKQDTKKRVH